MPKQEKDKETTQNVQHIQPRSIAQEMKESYIDYAMSVIVSRALPDVRDGLKPVQRRILYAMYEMGLRHDAKFRKSATVVGSCLGHFHPHGDEPVYGALARMAQDFSLRYLLVKGQGNFGSLDGDPPASMRYTEVKLSKIGEETLKDIEKDTVDFMPNFDGTTKEPIVLPSPLPQLLLNGCLGIAVGMATSIPPHNLSELCDACIYLVDHPKAGLEELFEFVQGPDFPTGGIIYDKNAIFTAYSQGNGSIRMRGKAEIKETKAGARIIISEIPFGIQKSGLVQQIVKLVQDKKIQGIRDVRDESDREGIRVVVDLRADSQPQRILNFLFRWTSLQTSFHMNMIALIDGIQPKKLNLAEMLKEFLGHRIKVVIRRTEFDLRKAKERCHILDGFHKALKDIDAIIKTIKASKDRPDAEKNLIKKFKLTKIQANAILEMKLASLARLERQKIEDELKQIKERIKELMAILKSPIKIKNIIKKDLEEYKKIYGDKRRTKLVSGKVGEMSVEDLIPQETAVITLSQKGYIKRVKPSVLRIQKRGGKGMLGQKTSGDDVVEHLIFSNTHDNLLFFTDSGKVFQTRVFEVPEAKRIARGKSLLNFLDIGSQEKVLALLPFPKNEQEMKYFVMATKKGIIKKTAVSEFENVRKTGLIAINLKKDDLLRGVRKSRGEDDIILVTKKGKAIRFKERDIRPMGRTAAGVRGIRLGKGDEIIGMEIIKTKEQKNKRTKEHEGDYLLVVSENGYGKRTPVAEYRLQKRGGSGIKTANVTKKTGELVAAKGLNGSEEHLMAISQHGQVIKMSISGISKIGRATQGVRIMRLGEQDKVASIAVI